VTGYLLDTNVLSDLIRNPAGAAARRIAQVGEDAVATSVIVAGELRYGAAKRASPQLTERVEALLAEIPVLPLAPPADAAYGRLRAALEAAGTPIGGNDMLIAAHALALGRTVVTANVGEFGRVEDLAVENWLVEG
jgi:tRNA(fMet)-specific endonuclease VapC